MKPVFQTKFKEIDGIGNCVQAAIASYLEKELDEIPDFITGVKHGGDQYALFYQYFLDIGLGLVRSDPKMTPKCTYLAIGSSERGNNHMCLYNQGQLVHDPYPGGGGLKDFHVIYIPVITDFSMWKNIKEL